MALQSVAPISQKHKVFWASPTDTHKTKEDQIDDLVCAPCQRKEMLLPCGKLSTNWKRCMLMTSKNVNGFVWDDCMAMATNLADCIVRHPKEYPAELETAQQMLARPTSEQ